MKSKIILLFAIMFAFVAFVSAQNTIKDHQIKPSKPDEKPREKWDQNEAIRRDNPEFDNLLEYPRDDSLPRDVENEVKVSKAIREQHQLFLKTPDSGIARFFPSRFAKVVNVNANTKPVSPETAFFSFKTKLHQLAESDIRFDGKVFKTGGAADSFGVFRSLGSVAVETITSDSPEAVALMKLDLPADRDSLIESRKSPMTEAEATLGKTYLLRTAHSGKTELLIAFNIVEIDKDGSATIIWKRLYKGKAPKFKE